MEPRVPEVDLAELLLEADAWTRLRRAPRALSGSQARFKELPCVLYAGIVAQATNLGLHRDRALQPAVRSAARVGVRTPSMASWTTNHAADRAAHRRHARLHRQYLRHHDVPGRRFALRVRDLDRRQRHRDGPTPTSTPPSCSNTSSTGS
ncbi:MAG: Tn3 family transposase [Solirubrobacterales bacterium]|nr:Tn3 family transposase [Solirubrobacterales bacterium]